MSAEDAVLRTVSPRLVRGVAIAVCVAGVAGMIGGSIADNNGIAITFGLVAAVGALVIIVVAAINPTRPAAAGASPTPVAVDEAEAEALEAKVRDLVASGADEDSVRDLVRHAVRLGRTSR
jgi:hypothetical protein